MKESCSWTKVRYLSPSSEGGASVWYSSILLLLTQLSECAWLSEVTFIRQGAAMLNCDNIRVIFSRLIWYFYIYCIIQVFLNYFLKCVRILFSCPLRAEESISYPHWSHELPNLGAGNLFDCLQEQQMYVTTEPPISRPSSYPFKGDLKRRQVLTFGACRSGPLSQAKL